MKITFDIPDAVAARVVAALGEDRREGETPAQAAKRNVVEYIKRQVALYEGCDESSRIPRRVGIVRDDSSAARRAALDKAAEEVTIQ